MTRNFYGQRPYNAPNAYRERPMPEYRVSVLPAETPPAMAYVPMQTDTTVYDESKALSAGTLFPCLDKPFHETGDRK